MRRILFITLAVMIAFTASSRQPQRGYRGFMDWNNSLIERPGFLPADKNHYYYSGISTSHGYQINPMWFVGAGISVESNKKFGTLTYIIPVFLQGRADFKLGKFTPFVDARIGYSLTDGGGIYFSPSIGYRFNWGRKLGINVGVGATIKGNKHDLFGETISPEGYTIYVKTGSYRDHETYFSFRVGIDF